MHATNPWGTAKNPQNLANDILGAILEVRELLELHAAFIRAKTYSVVWVVNVPKGGEAPKIISAIARGDFCVKNS